MSTRLRDRASTYGIPRYAQYQVLLDLVQDGTRSFQQREMTRHRRRNRGRPEVFRRGRGKQVDSLTAYRCLHFERLDEPVSPKSGPPLSALVPQHASLNRTAEEGHLGHESQLFESTGQSC